MNTKLTHLQAQVLGALTDGGYKTASDLASDLLISEPSVRSALNALERKAFVGRTYTSQTTHRILFSETRSGAAASRLYFEADE